MVEGDATFSRSQILLDLSVTFFAIYGQTRKSIIVDSCLILSTMAQVVQLLDSPSTYRDNRSEVCRLFFYQFMSSHLTKADMILARPRNGAKAIVELCDSLHWKSEFLHD